VAFQEMLIDCQSTIIEVQGKSSLHKRVHQVQRLKEAAILGAYTIAVASVA
jgi:hypothetical protein